MLCRIKLEKLKQTVEIIELRCTNIGESKDQKTERIKKQETIHFGTGSDAINK